MNSNSLVRSQLSPSNKLQVRFASWFLGSIIVASTLMSLTQIQILDEAPPLEKQNPKVVEILP